MSDRLKPSLILHNTRLNQGLCAISNVTIFPPFSDLAYPFQFKSFEKLPETIGEIKKSDVVSWNYSLFEADRYPAGISSTISTSTEKANDVFVSSAAVNLKLSLSCMKTVRIFVDPKKIHVPELNIREARMPHIERFVQEFKKGYYGTVGLIAVSVNCLDEAENLCDGDVYKGRCCLVDGLHRLSALLDSRVPAEAKSSVPVQLWLKKGKAAINEAERIELGRRLNGLTETAKPSSFVDNLFYDNFVLC